MAFTLPSYVADPTLITGDLRLPTYVADPTLHISALLPAFVADPTAVPHTMALPAFAADPTQHVSALLPAYVADGLPASVPGFFAYTQLFTKNAVGYAGVVGTGAKTASLFSKSMVGVSAPPKTMQHFVKAMVGYAGITTSTANFTKTMQPFVKAMQSYPLGESTRRFQPFVKSASGVTGAVGSGIKTAGLFSKTMIGFIPAVGSSTRTMALFFVSMKGQPAPGTSFKVISMHTERQALTEYQNFPFNSFCIFQGKVYGTSAAGLFEITGKQDNGSQISCSVAGGVSDYGDSHLKTIDVAYAGYRTDGDMIISIVQHDDGTQYDYTMPSTGPTGIYGRRVPTGKGLRARYYQWKIRNSAGSSISLDRLELNVRQLRRRIGNSDA